MSEELTWWFAETATPAEEGDAEFLFEVYADWQLSIAVIASCLRRVRKNSM